LNFREKMLRSAKVKDTRLVLALDFSDPYAQRLPKARMVLDATKSSVAAVKMNHHLLLPFGLSGVKPLVETCKVEGLPLIADLKMNDIESTNMNIIGSLLDFGFDAVIANPFVGKEEGLGGVMRVVHARNGGVILLVYMSHKGAPEGYGLKLEDGRAMYQVFAARARDWGADGVVVSAMSGDKIRETRSIVGKDCLILSPGVGPQGGEPGSGSEADFLIVGRSITGSDDPLKVVRGLNRRG
jgi:orotidine-5'-phosphate decarboxylase